ncbi:50S ribosomal protein L9 [Chloroflexota bacterium]
MEVVFLQDVPSLARAGEIKKVADGYARNFLIPRKLASLATKGAIQNMEASVSAGVRREVQTEAELLELAEQLAGKEFVLQAKTGGSDRLYGSITTADIAGEIERSTGLSIDKRKIEIGEAIRQVGSHEVTVRLAQNITPKVTITVTEQNT